MRMLLAVGKHAPTVWMIEATDEVLDRWADPETLLTPDEGRRWQGLVFERDRRDYLAAHIVVRECVADVASLPVEQIRLSYSCPDCGSSAHGRPSIVGEPQLYVSLSHARSVVAAVAGYVPVGVDVEPRDHLPARHPTLLTAFLSANELAQLNASYDPGLAFLRQWVRKEALIKVGALGMDALGGADLLDAVASPGMTPVWNRWRLHDWLDARCVGAVALPTARSF